ncbi:hypothetical protein C482_08708 [Natrialba chahannaoensis JCM 10990]|uniref:Uncharacterized protein n=1 Tax=Natrialba chahannaoensis JCM 10990 TaxID=1227492 RepID=M0ASJ9_9EURY|nr:hypothetical protein [Natrialba chahannaoensis]ELZ00928.1 hypothetical protein C482_08708 [Natrialba chahannaoensis JCM 10990]
MRTLTTLGIWFIIFGAVLLAGPVFGFGTISADRGVMVQTADDSDSLLKITDTSEQTVVTPESDAVFFQLTDTTEQIDDITVESVSITGVETAGLDVTAEQIDENEYTVSVACHESDIETDAPVSVTLEATGDVHVVADRTTNHAVSIECGAAEDTYDDEFDGGNDAIEIEDDGRFEDEVAISGSGSIDAGGNLVFEDEMNVDGSASIAAGGDITFEDEVTITGSGSITAEGDITFEDEVELSGSGSIHAGGDITFEDEVDTGGGGTSITADGEINGL